MKIVITGGGGLLGWHAAVRLHARNCAAKFAGDLPPFEIVVLDHVGFDDPVQRHQALRSADAVLHFAGVNRASDAEVECGNPAIAETLIAACRMAGAAPHIVYANSTHSTSGSVYGGSKRRAGESLSQLSDRYTNLILPHIFGECARPRYNNVTATFIEAVIAGDQPVVSADGSVALLHAGDAVEAAIAALLDHRVGDVVPEPRKMAVPQLLDKITGFHRSYEGNIFPDLSDPLDLALFNSYRAALYPSGFPRALKVNTDDRGALFEAVKGGGGGQTFLSWTRPDVTRGNHFHLHKVERFLVLEGEAIIRVRRVLGGPVWEYRVSGNQPAPVDMPTLHTHNITNIGDKPLLTMFWTHDLFDSAAPDTFADPVTEVAQ